MRIIQQHRGLNRHQRRAQYAVPSRSKPLVPRKGGSQRGRAKYLALIERAERLSRGPAFLRRTAVAVKRALMGV